MKFRAKMIATSLTTCIVRNMTLKRKTPDAIVNKFADNLQVASQHGISKGKLDIAILPDNAIAILPDKRIVFMYNKKVK